MINCSGGCLIDNWRSFDIIFLISAVAACPSRKYTPQHTHLIIGDPVSTPKTTTYWLIKNTSRRFCSSLGPHLVDSSLPYNFYFSAGWRSSHRLREQGTWVAKWSDKWQCELKEVKWKSRDDQVFNAKLYRKFKEIPESWSLRASQSAPDLSLSRTGFNNVIRGLVVLGIASYHCRLDGR